MIPAQLTEQIKRDEGYRRFPYLDSLGILTVAYGRNLISRGISISEAEVLLRNDIEDSWNQCRTAIPVFRELDEARCAVLANMCLNIGIKSLLGFRKMLRACAAGNYELAAVEMLDSTWHRQVGARAERLAEQMRTGEWA